MSLIAMRWCARCRRRLYDLSAAFCPFDGSRLDVCQPESRRGSTNDADAGDPYLDTTLQGQFQVEAAIGSGAMGTVYRAWQSGMERAVAIKILHADLLGDVEMRQRFLREGRAAARLNHPNIVSVYTVGETDAGVPYLVMEHLQGETLDELLDRETRVPPDRAVAIARQIASALGQAHDAGIVHRDLKPGNVVLLQRRGSGEVVKLFDFGIAKIADGKLRGGDPGRLTRDGEIFGTPHYIAPEQAQGGALDGRADLYSLGILLYRMLSGRLPFEGAAVAVLLAHIGVDPPDLADVAPAIDRPLAAVVMRCLAKEPARRFASADELIAALDEARATTRRPPSFPRPPSGDVPIIRVAGHAVDAGSSWTRARPAWSAALRAPGVLRGPRAGAALAGIAAVVLCAGAGTGAAALFRSGALARISAGEGAHSGRAGRVDRPRTAFASAAADLVGYRAVLVSEGGPAVRALLPETIRAGHPVELLFDVWDETGGPLQAPAIPVALAWAGAPSPAVAQRGSEDALAARPVTGQPGRYRLRAEFPAAGEAAVLLEMVDGSSIHLHFEVAPGPDS